MAEQILVTKALDERDLLKKKIIRAIDDASFVATKRKKDDKCANGYTRGMSPVSLLDIEEFKQNATSQYQSINDMIKRYNDINAAITLSNATTVITVAGKLPVSCNSKGSFLVIFVLNRQLPYFIGSVQRNIVHCL